MCVGRLKLASPTQAPLYSILKIEQFVGMSVMPAHNRALCLYDGYDCRIPLQLPLLTLSLKYSFQSEALLVSCISTAWGPLSSTSHYFKFHSHGWHGIQDVYKAGVWSWTAVRRMWRQVTMTLSLWEWYVRVLFELPEPDSPLGTPSVYPFHLAGIVIPTFWKKGGGGYLNKQFQIHWGIGRRTNATNMRPNLKPWTATVKGR